jgi:uncharacterized protein YuzE
MVNQVLESYMKVEYDRETDTLNVRLREGEAAESDEDKAGVILDYDDVGNLRSIEVLDASQRVEEPLTTRNCAKHLGSTMLRGDPSSQSLETQSKA